MKKRRKNVAFSHDRGSCQGGGRVAFYCHCSCFRRSFEIRWIAVSMLSWFLNGGVTTNAKQGVVSAIVGFNGNNTNNNEVVGRLARLGGLF